MMWRDRIRLAREEAARQASRCGRVPLVFLPLPPGNSEYSEFTQLMERLIREVYGVPAAFWGPRR